MHTQISDEVTVLPRTPVLEEEDAILAYTHGKRKQIIEDLMKAGVPSDPDNIKVLLSALKDQDTIALGRKRIKVDLKVNATQEQAAALISQILTRVPTNVHAVAANINISAPILPSSIPSPDLLPEETSTSILNLNYDEFMSKFEESQE